MRRFLMYILLGFSIALISCSRTGDGKTDDNKDKQIGGAQFDYVKSISVTNPQKAFSIIADAEKKGSMQDIDINTLKSMVYNNGLCRYDSAAVYARKALDNPVISKYPERQQMLLDNIASQYYKCGEYAKSMEMAEKGIDLAYKSGNRRLVAQLLSTIGQCYVLVGSDRHALRSFDRSIEILTLLESAGDTWEASYDIVYMLTLKADLLLDTRNYNGLFEMEHVFDDEISDMCSKKESIKGCTDIAKANYYSIYALGYLRAGNKEKGEDFYKKLKATDYANSPEGASLSVEYLIAVKDYKGALGKVMLEEQQWEKGEKDSVNFFFVHKVLMNKTRVLQGLGRYKEAIETGMQAYSMSDSLDSRIRAQRAILVSEKLGKKILRNYIGVQDRMLEMNTTVIIIMSVLLLACLVLLFIVWRSNRLIKEKNRSASILIGDLQKYRTELYDSIANNSNDVHDQIYNEGDATTDNTDNDVQGDNENFEYRQYLKIEKTIFEKKLFVRYKLSKDEVAEEVGMSLGYFNKLFAKYSDVSFNNYINNLRMDYAAKILKEKPYYSIEAVAKECGISVRQTFYRLFTKKFGMTPVEYRSSIEFSGECYSEEC